MWIKLLAHFTSEMVTGSKAGANPKSWARFVVAKFLVRFMPAGLASFLAAPIAGILLTLVRRQIVVYKTEGQAKEVVRLAHQKHKDPEELRKAFIQLANVEG